MFALIRDICTLNYYLIIDHSHPDQTINRDPPMQFQNEQMAEEYYPNEAWLNEYAWMYIVGGVLILFAVLGCCYCLCTMGEKPTPGLST